MVRLQLYNFILRTELEDRVSEKHGGGNSPKSIKTEDYVFIDSLDDVKNIESSKLMLPLTDYALASGVKPFGKPSFFGRSSGGAVEYFLRTSSAEGGVRFVDENGGTSNSTNVECEGKTVRPCMNLNLPLIIQARREIPEFGKIEKFKDSFNNEYHTIEFGEYPQMKESVKWGENLDKLRKNGLLPLTGTIYRPSDYEYRHIFGMKEVCVIENKADSSWCFSDKTAGGRKDWFRVEPIKWVICNWDEMPKSINPKGSGKAEKMLVKSKDAILGPLKFFEGKDNKWKNLWQNSEIRAYLNGYDLFKEIDRGNGNKNFMTDTNFYFVFEKGFLMQAFNSEIELSFASEYGANSKKVGETTLAMQNANDNDEGELSR